MTVRPIPNRSFPLYEPPWYLPNGHWQTIVPALTRRVRKFRFQRQELPTLDGDILQLDVLAAHSTRLVVISHGLEGDSNRPYVRGMTRAFHREGYDVIAWNFRGCGGVMNKTLRFYHSGATDDLHHLLTHYPGIERYQSIVLVGFSLGGNLTLKYLGESGPPKPSAIQGAITFSVPMDLYACAHRISQPDNAIYHRRFVKQLKQKIINKHPFYPEQLPIDSMAQIQTLVDFDDCYTAPLFGFRNATDYYHQSSSRQFLGGIQVPTLIVNAHNDPFLTPKCFDFAAGQSNQRVTFLSPQQGGHCGFMPKGHQKGKNYWSEQVALLFAKSILPNEDEAPSSC